MADGGQRMRFKLDKILLYDRPPCALDWILMKPTNWSRQCVGLALQTIRVSWAEPLV